MASTTSNVAFGNAYRSVQAHTINGSVHIGLENTLDRLPYAQDAVFNSATKQHEPTCLPDTRVDLLREIYSWADGPDARCIFWLSGLAGTGKSTIARTVARRYHDRQRLAASFFFSRGGGDVGHAGKFVTSIAVQLAHNVPASRQHISDAVVERSDIVSQSLGDQWRHLVLRPLSKLHEPEPYMVVIDALDECDNNNNIRIIVQLLAKAQSLTGARLRVFMTSRPDEPIHYGFVQVPHTEHQDFALHRVSPLVVNNDIRLFLEHELRSITQKRRLGTDWPGVQVIAQLVESASRLFIWAATACRFIEDGGVRRVINDRLQTILRSSGPMSGPEEHLNKIYITVLTSSIPITFTKEEKEQFCDRARYVIGSLVVLLSPLSPLSLGRLLPFEDLVTEDDVEDILQGLHAILDIPECPAEPLRLHHPSFRDFLLNRDRCRDANFWVEKKSMHEKLASRCLELMSALDGLQKDMCSLPGPGTLRSEINAGSISSSLPPELQYACRYWVEHIEHGQRSIADGDAVHAFLQTHLLHWLEAMSLMGELGQCVRLLTRLQVLVASPISACAGFLRDANRLVLRFGSIVAEAPLQVYSSALLFAPERSIVRKTFVNLVSPEVQMLSDRDADWDACRSVLEGHTEEVSAVVFSRDGQLLASASKDKTVRVWETATGTCRHELTGHTASVTAVVFSPDGQLVASASNDETVRVWEMVIGTCRYELTGHTNDVRAVVFSRDGQLVASASYDETVRVWETATGTCRHELMGHTGSIGAVVFSRDGQLVASASYDKTVRVWEMATGTCRHELTGHIHYVTAVVFSPDGQLVASASNDKTVRVWDTATGTCRHELTDYTRGVTAVVFSPDGQLVASASKDKTVRVWETATGTCRHELTGHTRGVTAVVFSPDGQLVASASNDKIVRVWETATGTCCHELTGHIHYVTAVVFSPDGQLVASASNDETVRVWDTATGTCRHELTGHTRGVTVVAFSRDGQLVASASYDKTVRVWETATGTCRHELTGHTGDVRAVVFSLDGSALHTNRGDITLPLDLSLTSPVELEEHASHLSVGDQWVLRNTQRFLWLPFEYRAHNTAACKDIVCLGCPFGRVALLRLQ